ncbi:alpha/beta hydrolase [Caloramator proteoclasticus]|uniref:Alpha/beta hydrolase family protein n=1 Tax=Caloramator proteoclasticus DSM 10124 TaxID=1121262 RepID=A0A1M4T050_9CLOT|nr:alpha/beta hydrolase [Caloramator proteoclasticus]SHE37815.1 Alpha/beta hydrolase family protein [Caloramator proteoclasticus DSM 10124]
MKKAKKIAGVLLSLICILTIIFLVWAVPAYKPNFDVEAFIKSNEKVKIQIDRNIVINPLDKKAEKGVIFYPGGKVESSAYIKIASKIAEKGYRVVITPMPLNLAIFGKNKAEEVIKENSDIDIWVIGGHSLGGVMASDYAYNHLDKIKGLFLLASYPQEKFNFKDKDIKALSIWGSEDKVANLDKIKSSKNIMPNDTVFVEIKGGNHGQFGSYGKQKGDGEAKISEEEQQNITSEYIVKFLDIIK